jgi:hypothetical protein
MLSYVTRQGKLIPADEAFHACNSGDLKPMLAALDAPTNLVDLHFLNQARANSRDASPAQRPGENSLHASGERTIAAWKRGACNVGNRGGAPPTRELPAVAGLPRC